MRRANGEVQAVALLLPRQAVPIQKEIASHLEQIVKLDVRNYEKAPDEPSCYLIVAAALLAMYKDLDRTRASLGDRKVFKSLLGALFTLFM